MKPAAAIRVVAGRAVARAGIQLSLVALLPVWGAAEFGRYAGAVGAFGWLVFLVLGAEKTALTVLPRTPRLAALVARTLLARAAGIFGIGLAAAAALAPAGGTPALFGAAAAYAAGQGVLSTLASLHRLDGHPGREGAAFAAFAVGVVALTGLAVAGTLSSYGYLLGLIACVSVVSAVLAAGLRGRVRYRRAIGLPLTRRMVLAALPEVADSASIAVLYVLLAVAGTPEAAALVYVAMLVSNVAGGFAVLLMRIAQPATSLRMRGVAGGTGRHRARRISAVTALVAGGAVVVVLLAAQVTAVAGPVWFWGVLAVELTTFAAVAYAMYLVENTNGAALAKTSSAAVLGLAVTAATAPALVAAFGALGALLALVAGLAGKAGLLHLRLRDGVRRSPAPRDDELLGRMSAQ